MSYLRHLVFFQTITPLHVGCGQDVGVVDLPVIRERTTGYPFIPGSGLRGSLRDLCSQRASANIKELFGPDAGSLEQDENATRHAGCVAIHDAHLLLFPVRSEVAPFLWITCPAVLRRFSRHTGLLLENEGWKIDPGASPGEEELLEASRSRRSASKRSISPSSLSRRRPLSRLGSASSPRPWKLPKSPTAPRWSPTPPSTTS